MADANVANDLLWPKAGSAVLVRVAFLYVGQGSSIAVLVRDRNAYRSLLLDINLDEKNGGIDVPALMSDVLGGAALDVFLNTHPHDDHLRGIVRLAETVQIRQVWHSGHVPGKSYRDSYDDLQKVIKKVTKAGGTVAVLQGSRTASALGDAQCHVLAPAEYVSDDVNDEDPDARYRRIHEHCTVLKLGKDETWVLITGDADRDAFEKHITGYHKSRLGAVVLDAPHHGSRTLFRYDEEDDPYLDALQAISPEYVVLSAPTSKESPHDHPHADAVKLYRDQVGRSGVLHTGEKRYSFICDIFDDGTYSIEDDKGALAEAYGLGGDSDKGRKVVAAGPVLTRVDDRPMGR
ncbi:MAG: ComEC/Rec2 family competence protein [Armatimonadota bacterium]